MHMRGCNCFVGVFLVVQTRHTIFFAQFGQYGTAEMILEADRTLERPTAED